MQWGGVVMGVGAGTHTLLCVYVGVVVSQGVCVLFVQGSVGRRLCCVCFRDSVTYCTLASFGLFQDLFFEKSAFSSLFILKLYVILPQVGSRPARWVSRGRSAGVPCTVQARPPAVIR